jgi:hypothetical protein
MYWCLTINSYIKLKKKKYEIYLKYFTREDLHVNGITEKGRSAC